MNSFKLLINFIEQCRQQSGNGRYSAVAIDGNAKFTDLSTTKSVTIMDDGIAIEEPSVSYLHIHWDTIPEKYKREIVELLTEDEIDKEIDSALRSFFT